MIEFLKGDMFESDATVLVNPVNCVGAMGKGLALEFKKRFPKMFQDYKKACQKGKVKIGKMWYWNRDDYDILNFPTKNDWRYPSQYDYIESGLIDLHQWLKNCFNENAIVAIPALGCSNGGLDWKIVKPMIDSALGDLDMTIYVYEPRD